jgi:NADH:ubiquinone oxidoreductase subunit E
MSENVTDCYIRERSEEELLADLHVVIDEYSHVPGGLIPVLQIAQTMFGYLPEKALVSICEGFGKSYSEVAGVVSFYSFFSTVPKGRNMIRVCLGTACYVRGGKEVLAALKKEIGIDIGETTGDREFSLEIGRCFGACGLAPVLMVNDDIHQRVRPTKVGDILGQYVRSDDAASESGREAE